jgi:hypothetical protein
MENLQVARTILEQLGGRKFTVMTGAKNFVGSDTSLSFRLPGGGGFCKGGINAVRITLNGRDTYDLEFSRIRGTKVTVVDAADDIYADQLRGIFTRATGLAVSLGTMSVTVGV